MAELRGAALPSGAALNGLVDAVEEFSRTVIDHACCALTRTPFEPYAPRVVTELELVNACRKASVAVKKSRFCGRCQNGYIRLGGEVVMCECCCRECGGCGFVFIRRNGENYARNCPTCRPAQSEVA